MRAKQLAVIVLVLLLAGCTFQDNPEPVESDEIRIELTLCGINSVNEETATRIGTRLEELLCEKLGTSISLKLMIIPLGNYNEQLNLMFLQEREPDLFAIYKQTEFNDLVSNGLLAPLNGLVTEYFLSADELPEAVWGLTTRQGVVYGIPQYTQQEGCCCVYLMDAKTAQEFQVDAQKRWSWDELHDLLLQIKAKYPETYPILPHYGVVGGPLGQDSLGDSLGVLVDASSPSTTVENWYTSEEYATFCRRMRQWYQEGLILPDAYDTQSNIYSMIESGLGQGGLFQNSYQQDERYVSLQLTDFTANLWNNPLVWGISKNCENPQEALKVLNIMYSDPDVALLLGFGEESIDYTLDESGRLTLLHSTTLDTYWHSNYWAWPGIDRLQGRIANLGEFWILPQQETPIYSPAYGFVYDPSDVQLAVERCLDVVEKYEKGLACGFLDPESTIPAFAAELDQAGIGQIIAEKQRQLDIWLEAHG